MSLKIDIPYDGSYHNLVDRADVIQHDVAAGPIKYGVRHGKHGSVRRQSHSGSKPDPRRFWVRDVVAHAPLARAHTEIVHLHKACI